MNNITIKSYIIILRQRVSYRGIQKCLKYQILQPNIFDSIISAHLCSVNHTTTKTVAKYIYIYKFIITRLFNSVGFPYRQKSDSISFEFSNMSYYK